MRGQATASGFLTLNSMPLPCRCLYGGIPAHPPTNPRLVKPTDNYGALFFGLVERGLHEDFIATSYANPTYIAAYTRVMLSPPDPDIALLVSRSLGVHLISSLVFGLFLVAPPAPFDLMFLVRP